MVEIKNCYKKKEKEERKENIKQQKEKRRVKEKEEKEKLLKDTYVDFVSYQPFQIW